MDEAARYTLALTRIKGVKRADLFELLKELAPTDLFEACLGRSPGPVPVTITRAVRGFDEWGWVDRELELVQKAGARVLTLQDPDYPTALREICDPPLILYAKGNLDYGKTQSAVAVVGTRRPTHYGVTMAETISRDLALRGVVVVSGMARGCDTAAHRGALKADGATTAVLGTGIDIVYPKENARLYEEISRRGLLLSEYPMSTPPRPFNFPRRNRIISGMSKGVLVVEAPLRSGAMMTARLALDYNREVFAVPGPATSYKSKGSNRLIKDGAVVVEEAMDIIDVMGFAPGEYKTTEGEDNGLPVPEGGEKIIFDVLGPEPLFIDEVIERTRLPAATVSSLLLQMEIKGIIIQMPGKSFVRSF